MARVLAAYGLKRIDDMSRDELVATINGLYGTLLAITGRTLGEDRTALPHSEVDQYQAVLEKWFMGDVLSASAVDPLEKPEG